MSNAIELVSKVRTIEEGYRDDVSSSEFEPGVYHRISHSSSSTQTKMTFGLFLPSSWSIETEMPVLFFLSGLTCDDTNFAMKAGSRAFDMAEKYNLAIVMPDTSPRGDGIPNVDEYDFGIGAGFYINATKEPYSSNYHMYDYVNTELPRLLEETFGLGKNGQKSICGHSMGGHGSLVSAFREGPKVWKSVSAFAPICNPSDCPWGKKAFDGYFDNPQDGSNYDATYLLKKMSTPLYHDILIDQGTADSFLKDQLKPEALMDAAKESGQKITLNMRKGFDHSYYFIAKFIESHVIFHGEHYLQTKA